MKKAVHILSRCHVFVVEFRTQKKNTMTLSIHKKEWWYELFIYMKKLSKDLFLVYSGELNLSKTWLCTSRALIIEGRDSRICGLVIAGHESSSPWVKSFLNSLIVKRKNEWKRRENFPILAETIVMQQKNRKEPKLTNWQN